MKWPKYYENELIIPNPQGHIGIVCGWTKKERIFEIIDKNNLEKIGAIGQLYSKEGINYIIRNLFLNPQITSLIITGNDLSSSLEKFIELLKTKKRHDFLHRQIPQEKLNIFLNWFAQNTYKTEEKQLNYLISKIPFKKNWIEKKQEFEEVQQVESTDFASEEVCFRLEDRKIADLWLKILDRIMKFGRNKMSQYSEIQRELVNMTTVISEEDPQKPYLPNYLYFTENDLNEYYPQLMSDKIFEGVEYTYGSRLRNFEGINQIDFIIKDLQENNYSRRAMAFVWDVKKDTGNPKCPCLNLINALIQADKLYLTVYMRSNDMYRAWPQNAFAFRKIQAEISEKLNIKIGKLCIISNSAHIYERDFVSALETIQKNKPNLECINDPRGNFEIQVKDNKIVANHYSPQGLLLQTFSGSNSREIQEKIFTFVSDISHAIYLGRELHKAQLSLENKLLYSQDNDLSLNKINA